MRKNISTNTPSEKRVGYSRAVLVGDTIYFSGTTARDEEGKTMGHTIEEQTTYCFGVIKSVLQDEGFSLNDVVATTVYLVDMNDSKGFDKAFQQYFFGIKPCCTLVGVKELVSPDLLVEIECIAQKS